ncbi:MAG: lipoprotein-releasing ABC transporter permease subunit [Burkholderiales bacterium]|jgi:lipoprotein-releasing system permease protein|nr:lipoprotein-releasing ABC transporter permease subunit [Burkholderiales bacterium]
MTGIPYEFLVGLRYTRSRKGASREAFVSVISMFSMAGIALGVAALIVVLSVMNGFQKEIRTRILSVASHVEIRAFPELDDWAAVEKIAKQNPRVIATAPYVLGQALLSRDGVSRGSILRGVDPAHEELVADIGSHMKAGRFDALTPGSFGIVLGLEQAKTLGVEMGDDVVVIIPQGLATPAGTMPRLRSFKVAGIFDIGMYEFDSGLAFVNIEDAQRLYRMIGVSGVRLKVNDLFQASMIGMEIAKQLPFSLEVRDWTRSHTNLFRAVQLTKQMMFLFLMLIIFVAVFNIISAQVMVVTEKQADIAILRTLGASPSSILGIFIFQGALVGVIGTLIGVIGGIALALNVDVVVPAIERLFSIQFLNKSVYPISDVPSDLQSGDVIKVATTALFLALAATVYPAWKAARVNPAATLRYE